VNLYVLLLRLFKIRTDCRRFSSRRPTRRNSTVSSRRRCEVGITHLLVGYVVQYFCSPTLLLYRINLVTYVIGVNIFHSVLRRIITKCEYVT